MTNPLAAGRRRWNTVTNAHLALTARILTVIVAAELHLAYSLNYLGYFA